MMDKRYSSHLTGITRRQYQKFKRRQSLGDAGGKSDIAAGEGASYASVEAFNVRNTSHGHTADNVTFDIPILIDDAAHAHAAENVTVS